MVLSNLIQLKLQSSGNNYAQLSYPHMLTIVQVFALRFFRIIFNFSHQHALKYTDITGY